jgi:N-acetylglucosamine-6-sulfatase
MNSQKWRKEKKMVKHIYSRVKRSGSSKILLLVTSVALTMLFSWSSTGSYPAAAQQGTAQPNFVFILADDMQYMPKTRSLLQDQGMSFEEAFVSNAICCPSRATIMRGQYSHNNGVWTNGGSDGGSDGGWWTYHRHGGEQDNVATRLDAAGYRTGLFGKYLNGYNGNTVPRGWDVWFGGVWMGGVEYYDYDINDNGTIRHFGATDKDYLTDVLRMQTKAFIGASVAQGKPFFAYVAPTAPHVPSIPATRDLHAYDGEKAPRPPSFNEDDVSDKPPWISSRPPLRDDQIAQIDTRQENRAETLQALDDLIEGIVNKLNSDRVLNNTYIFFTSDNGLESGEHRIPGGKLRPYEESIRMPLLVRGPGVAAGSTTDKLALNTDFFPTLANLAGIRKPSYVDGRSLRPVLKGSAKTWRSAILLEHRDLRDPSTSRSYYGMRTSDGSKYVEYEQGFRELYDLNTDPFELSNSYDAATPPPELAARLQALKACVGKSCRAAENGP